MTLDPDEFDGVIDIPKRSTRRYIAHPIRTRVEVPHNDAPGRHEWLAPLADWVRSLEESHNEYWQRWVCCLDNCPGRLLVREADLEQMVNAAVKETTNG